jgi:SseB protein C-terminal domain
MESIKTQKAIFLGEQDGPTERLLKTELAKFFVLNQEIISAYLARVSYVEVPGPQVALCLRGGEQNAQDLVQGIGKVFSRLFNPTHHLDILFLSEVQRESIDRVAKPFYLSQTSGTP